MHGSTGIPNSSLSIHEEVSQVRLRVVHESSRAPENSDPNSTTCGPSKELSNMATTINEKQLEVDTLAETNRILQAKIKEMRASMAKLEKDYAKEKEAHTVPQSEAKILKTGITSYEERIATL